MLNFTAVSNSSKLILILTENMARHTNLYGKSHQKTTVHCTGSRDAIFNLIVYSKVMADREVLKITNLVPHDPLTYFIDFEAVEKR